MLLLAHFYNSDYANYIIFLKFRHFQQEFRNNWIFSGKIFSKGIRASKKKCFWNFSEKHCILTLSYQQVTKAQLMHFSTIKKISQNLPKWSFKFWFRYFAYATYFKLHSTIIKFSTFLEISTEFGGGFTYVMYNILRGIYAARCISFETKRQFIFLSSLHTQSSKHIF